MNTKERVNAKPLTQRLLQRWKNRCGWYWNAKSILKAISQWKQTTISFYLYRPFITQLFGLSEVNARSAALLSAASSRHCESGQSNPERLSARCVTGERDIIVVNIHTTGRAEGRQQSQSMTIFQIRDTPPMLANTILHIFRAPEEFPTTVKNTQDKLLLLKTAGACR